MRALFWVQSLLGSGHLRRALAIARAMADEGFAVTVAHGGPSRPWPVPPGVELVQLPPVQARGEDLATLVDETGAPASPALFEARRDRLVRLVRTRRPALLLTELFPFGRRAFRHELLPLLEDWPAAGPRPLVVASVRDILVHRSDPARPREAAELARRLYDLVLVHADPRLAPFGLTFPAARMLWDRLRYTGYVLDTTQPAPAAETRAGVLVTVGGGAAAGRVLATALEAAALAPGLGPWRLIAGPDMPAEAFAELATRARGMPVELVRHEPDLPARLGRVRVVVARAGYNTVVEALAAGTPLVAVPFEAPGETEQRTRAERLEALGFACVLREPELTPARLVQAIDALARQPPASPRLALEGARRTARLLATVLARREVRP